MKYYAIFIATAILCTTQSYAASDDPLVIEGHGANAKNCPTSADLEALYQQNNNFDTEGFTHSGLHWKAAPHSHTYAPWRGAEHSETYAQYKKYGANDFHLKSTDIISNIQFCTYIMEIGNNDYMYYLKGVKKN